MTTPNIGLPEIIQNQSAKEITHNLALRMLDVLVPTAIVQTCKLSSPPKMVAGNLYIVGKNATGAWINQENKLAFTDGAGWYFIMPKNMWSVYVVDEKLQYRYADGGWEPEAVPLMQYPRIKQVMFSNPLILDWSDADSIFVKLLDNTVVKHVNAVEGQRLSLIVQQDVVGNRTIDWGSEVRFGVDIPSIILTADSGKQDKIGFVFNDDGGKFYDVVSFFKGF